MHWYGKLATLGLVVASLYLAREVLIPMALATLLAFLFQPLVKRLEKYGMGRVPAVLITFTIAATLISAMIYHIGNEIAGIVNDIPRYKTELVAKIKGIGGLGSGLGRKLDTLNQDLTEALGKPEATPTPVPDRAQSGTQQSVDKNGMSNATTMANHGNEPAIGSVPAAPLYVTEVKRSGASWLNWAESAGAIVGPLSTAGLVIVFTLFMMIYQDDLRDRIIKLVSAGQYVSTTRAINESATRISSYLVAQSIVNFSYGAVMMVGLSLIGWFFGRDGGFPNFLLWGTLCAILRFVPYAGPVVAALFPIAVATTVFPGFGAVIAVVVLIAIVELISNNLLEPWLYGSSTGISAMAVIFASVFWGWIWGPVGLLLATPLTVCLVVLGKHVAAFRDFEILFGDNKGLDLSTRLYQRLLAGDIDQAKRISRQSKESHDHIGLLDTVFVPILRRTRRDRESGRLSRDDELTLTDSLREILDELQPLEKYDIIEGLPHSVNAVRNPLIVAIPSHHVFEELILYQMAIDLRQHCEVLQIASTRTLPSTLEKQFENLAPDIVIVCVIPPGGLFQAEFLCNRIHLVSPDTKVLVIYLGKARNFDKLLVRFRKAGAGYVATSVEQSMQYVSSWMESSLSKRNPEN